MILITGSTGGLGKETMTALTKLIPVQHIAGLARDPGKALWLADMGITLKKGDYADYESLLAAFSGVEKLLMISAPAFSDPSLEANTVQAAKDAGVKYVVYTGIQRKKDSNWIIPGVTARDLEIERLLAASGMSYTIVHNALYMDALPFLLGDRVLEEGVLFPSAQAMAAVACRADLGEALARIVSAENYFPNHITLSNSQRWSREDIARILSEISGKNIPVIQAAPGEYTAYLHKSGVPEFYAAFAAEWAAAMKAGELAETDPLLENLLGRKPLSLSAFLKEAYLR